MMFASSHPVLRRNVYAPQAGLWSAFWAMRLQKAVTFHRSSKQDESAFHLSLDVPGVSREQLVITIEDAQVRINTREGASRNYRAAYELPSEINASESEAKLENGVLTLKLPKKIAVSNAVEITIQ